MPCLHRPLWKEVESNVTGRDTDSKDRALTAALWLEQVENGHKKSGEHVVFKSLRQETQLSVLGTLWGGLYTETDV